MTIENNNKTPEQVWGDRKVVAVFDFDNTLTRKDSLWHFLVYAFGIRHVGLSFIRKAPLFWGYLFGKITRTGLKASFMGDIARDIDVEEFTRIARKYSLEVVPTILKKAAFDKAKWHMSQGHETIIISASIGLWIEPWGLANGFNRVLSTQLEEKDGKFTGRMIGGNCFGKEKLNRLLEEYPNRDQYYMYAYGDSRGDRYLLKEADEAFYRRF